MHLPAAPEADSSRVTELCAQRLNRAATHPRWLTLGLTLPAADQAWLSRFTDALRERLFCFGPGSASRPRHGA